MDQPTLAAPCADTDAAAEEATRPRWIDTHCHLDAPEFDADREAVVQQARAVGVDLIVVPAVMPSTFAAARAAAQACAGVYALGIHPLYARAVSEDALAQLAEALVLWRDDPQLVAVGEIGLDHFEPALQDADSRALQERLCVAQMDMAAAAGLPVILHVRRSADALLKHLRRLHASGRPLQGIAHAFNGSLQQAEAFVSLGFKLGFGGAMTFERALQIRRLAQGLPPEALVLETDAPDIPPQWLYQTAAARAAGASSRNVPAELPRIAANLASLRRLTLTEVQALSTANAMAALPRMAAWWSARRCAMPARAHGNQASSQGQS